MDEQARQALAHKLADDEGFRTALMAAVDADDAARIAREHGIAASADDFTAPDDAEISDAELEGASGGTGYLVHREPETFGFCALVTRGVFCPPQ